MAQDFAQPISVEEFRATCYGMHVPLITRLMREKAPATPFDLYFMLNQLRNEHARRLGHADYALSPDEVKHLDSLIRTIAERFKIKI